MGTGNLRTLRISATGGSRTLPSIVTSSSSAGAGSTRRVLSYYQRLFNNDMNQFYNLVFGLQYGQFRSQYSLFR